MKYDLIIIGGGPAGLSAGIYAGRYKLNTLILSKNIGGVAATAYKICNYPSYNNIKGFELMKKFTEHVNDVGILIKYEEAIKIEKKTKGFKVFTKKSEYECKKIIFASGTNRIKLNVPGEGKFLGKGVSYCATCDALFFKNKIVAVIGGSYAALSSALLLSEYASKVYIIYRGNEFFRPEPVMIELVKKEKKIESIFNEEIIDIDGGESVENIRTNSGMKLKIDGVFIEAGSVPETNLLKNIGVKLSENGYVITDKFQKTNVEGLYSAGDVTDNKLKQIITAAAEGAIAAVNIYQEIKKEG
jgi:thioredoxin reductase (NADPH)